VVLAARLSPAQGAQAVLAEMALGVAVVLPVILVMAVWVAQTAVVLAETARVAAVVGVITVCKTRHNL
jgi:hypothetical protein